MKIGPAIWCATAAVAMLGCATADLSSPATRPTTAEVPQDYDVTVQSAAADPRATRPPAVEVDVFVVDLPAGTVSDDAAFWRTVDEMAIGGPAVADQLGRNGLRAGVVPRDQSASFARYFGQQPERVKKTTFASGQFGTVELDLDQHVDGEDVFVFDAAGHARGRTYGDCTNGVAMTYEAEPRRPDAVRVTLCPVIKSDRRRTSFSAMNERLETPFADVDRVYDLSLSVPLRGDQMLVVAAGPGAARQTSTIGSRFLLGAEAAERRERVILVVPTIVPTDGRSVRLRRGGGL